MFSQFELFGRTVPLYFVCCIAAAVLTSLYLIMQCRFARKTPPAIDPQDMLFMLLYAFIGAIIGAKVLYIITSVDTFWYPEYGVLDNLRYWYSIIAGGGLVFYGGLIGALLGALRHVVHFKAPISTMLDAGFAGVPLFHAIGRVGCFLAGCCYGIEYHGPLAVVFPETNLGGAPAGVELLPVQLIEASLNIVLWLILMLVYRRTSRRWLTSGIYLVSYGVIRFVLEFFRGDLIRGSVFSLSSSQFISIFIVAAGVLLLIDPKWLDKFGGKNDEIYTEQLKKLEQRKAERANAKS